MLAAADMSVRDVGVRVRRQAGRLVSDDLYNRLWSRLDWQPRRALDPAEESVLGAVDAARGLMAEKVRAIWRNFSAQD